MHGLSSAEAAEARRRAGPNALPERPPDSWWRRLARQFASPLIYILLAALAFDAGLWIWEGADGWPAEALAIATILLLNAVLGLVQEQRSEAALARLKALAGAHAWVWRDDQLVRIGVEEIVPGDLVRLEAGDRVPADGHLVDPHSVMVDESILTGESVPVDKGEADEVYSGTLVVRGRAHARIANIGAASAMGRLAGMLTEIETMKTPLERRVDVLGRQIARWVLGLAGVIGVVGIAAEGLGRAGEVVVFAVALAVAAVPEGLPAVLTVALALGVERMAKQRAVVRRLSAVEALGSITVIATDKTGTLTENRMDVRALDTTDEPRSHMALALANDADPDTEAGDPLDVGLLRFVRERGVNIGDLRRQHALVSDQPFDSAWKFARVTVRDGDGTVSYLKGAPEVVIGRTTLSREEQREWLARADHRASQGLRVIALAWGGGERDHDLTWLGLVSLWDPPRAEVADAVEKAQAAGIRVVMITGDHPATAVAVAGRIGIEGIRAVTGEALGVADPRELEAMVREVSVFARVRPEQKLRLVESLQSQGALVAMTGDGVNDAPALKRADVGVAMGVRGSDVTREVADLVLLDDNFATIVGAVEEGRSIYENIQKVLRFLFSTNLSEVLLVALGVTLAFALDLRDVTGGLLLPLTAAQILWINLITDGLPALALALDRTPGVMRARPRPPAAPLLDRPSLQFVAGVGTMKALLALLVLGLVPWWGYDTDQARTAAFNLTAIAQLLVTYPARHTWIRPMANPVLHAAVAGGIAIQVATSWPVLASALGCVPLPVELWALVFAGAGLAWMLSEGIAAVVWRRAAHEHA